ncbi:hypothetical protein ACFVTY_09430 [Streptomyces sp. NPDC058067]
MSSREVSVHRLPHPYMTLKTVASGYAAQAPLRPSRTALST